MAIEILKDFKSQLKKLPIYHGVRRPYWVAIDNTKFEKKYTLLPEETQTLLVIQKSLDDTLLGPLIKLIHVYSLTQMIYVIDRNGLYLLSDDTANEQQEIKLLFQPTSKLGEFESVFVDPSDRSVLLTTRRAMHRYNHTNTKELAMVQNELILYSRISDISSCGKIIILVSRCNCLQIVNLQPGQIVNLQPGAKNQRSQTIVGNTTPYNVHIHGTNPNFVALSENNITKPLENPFMAIVDSTNHRNLLISCKGGLKLLNQDTMCLTEIIFDCNVWDKSLFSDLEFTGFVSTPSEWYIMATRDNRRQSNIYACNLQTKQIVLLATPSIECIEHILYVPPSVVGGSPTLLIPHYNNNCLFSLSLAPFFAIRPSLNF